MGLFDRLESGLERAVNGAFARAFKSEVQPVEISAAMRRAMDDRVAIVGKDRTLVPNLFTIELSPTDYERLTGYSDVLVDELVAAAQEHAESQHYQPGGAIQVHFSSDADLETGVFRVRPAVAKVGPQSRSYAEPSPVREQSPAQPSRPAAQAAVAPRPAESLVQQAPVVPVPSPIVESERTVRQQPTARAPEPQRPLNPELRPWLDIDGEHYPLLHAHTVLGRDEAADIVLDDPGISRRHSEFRVTTDGPHYAISLRDMDSTNGTYVNGERITSQRLEPGDRITVGRTSLILRVGRR